MSEFGAAEVSVLRKLERSWVKAREVVIKPAFAYVGVAGPSVSCIPDAA